MLTRNLDKAKAAFKNRSVEEMREAHSGDRDKFQAEEEHQQEQGKYIKSMVYGGLDGIITTFAVVAGVAGAALSAKIVLIMGFANLIADGLSMAIGDFLSTKAEKEYNQTEREREEWEVEHYPEGEKLEMVELYEEKGLSKDDAVTIAEIFSKYKKAWVDIMMLEELEIVESDESPFRNAVATFFSFIIFGFIPLVSYVIGQFFAVFNVNTFYSACFLTGVTLFTLGSLKARITGKNWFYSGLEMLLVGGIAAAAAYGIGLLFSGI